MKYYAIRVVDIRPRTILTSFWSVGEYIFKMDLGLRRNCIISSVDPTFFNETEVEDMIKITKSQINNIKFEVITYKPVKNTQIHFSNNFKEIPKDEVEQEYHFNA